MDLLNRILAAARLPQKTKAPQQQQCPPCPPCQQRQRYFDEQGAGRLIGVLREASFETNVLPLYARSNGEYYAQAPGHHGGGALGMMPITRYDIKPLAHGDRVTLNNQVYIVDLH